MAPTAKVLGSRKGLLLRPAGGSSRVELAIDLLSAARRIDDAYNKLLVGHELSDGRLAALPAVSEAPGITPLACPMSWRSSG
jgi:hypothetical protein